MPEVKTLKLKGLHKNVIPQFKKKNPPALLEPIKIIMKIQLVTITILLGITYSFAGDGGGGGGDPWGWIGSWTTQTIDAVGVVGRYSSIAVDTSNNIHISYYDDSNADLKYAKWNGLSWATQTIDLIGSVGKYSSIAVGTDGVVWISYYDESNTNLKYAKWNGLSWSAGTVDSGGSVGKYSSIAIGPNNHPGVAYYDEGGNNWRYVSWNVGGYWNSGTNIDSHYNCPGLALKIGSDNLPQVTYINNTGCGILKHAKYNGWSWDYQELITSPPEGAYFDGQISLSLDSENNPHITCYISNGTTLKCLSYVNGVWNTVNVITSGGGMYSSILSPKTNDSNNRIMYNQSGLKFSSYYDGMWHTTTVDSGVNTGTYNISITSGVNNTIHCSYYDETTSDLKYACFCREHTLSSGSVNTNYGTSTMTYTFTTTYTSGYGYAPISGYPKIKIKRGVNDYLTLPMNFVSGSYGGGAVYSTSTLLSPCSYYNYVFDSYDIFNDSGTGPDVGYSISGTVYYPNGTTPFPSATLSAVSGETTRTMITGNDGSYQLCASNGLSWVMAVSSTPGVGNASFTPAVTYSNLSGNQSQNYQRYGGCSTLSWTGESGYISDGVEPNTGLSTHTYTFKIKYVDNENDAPAAGYPKVRIKKGVTDYLLLSMNYSGNTYTSGIICSTSTLLPACSYYSYTFESYDVWNTSASQFVTVSNSPDIKGVISGMITYPDGNPMPNVTLILSYGVGQTQTRITGSTGCYTFSPVDLGQNYTLTPSSFSYYLFGPNTAISYTFLSTDMLNQDFYRLNRTSISWTGEINYSSDGLDPEVATAGGVNLNYRLKYIDADNDMPDTGYPKVYILKSGTTVQNVSLMPTDINDTDCTNGKLYYYSTTLSYGRDYSYYFVVSDSFSLTAYTQTVPGPIVSTSAPQLVWTGETNYVSDGINPESGSSGTTFYYRIKYVDTDNDPPASGYPKLHVYRNQTEINGSPYTMSSLGGTNYIAGATYYYNLTNLSPSLDYTYSFEAYDEYNKSTSTVVLNAPDINSPPVLSWTGESDYTTDAVSPDEGTPFTTFYYHIKYTDADNQQPQSGYPKLHIKLNNVEISSYTMSYVSGIYQTGAIYSVGVALTQLTTAYAYCFECYDMLGATVTGIPTSWVDAPDVINNTPVLSWSGEVNYSTDGVHPDIALPDTTFYYRIKYTDTDNQSPASSYPKLHLRINGVEISSYTMTYASGTYQTGAIYSVGIVLTQLTTAYAYYFECYDILGATATGTPTSWTDAPDVINNTPVLSWTGEVNYSTDGVHPDIALPDTTFYYRIKYTDTDNQSPASGYPKLHLRINGVEISSYTMTYASGTYQTGAIYSVGVALTQLTTAYAYYFECYDILGATATGTPTSWADSPDVINNTPVLSWSGEVNYSSAGVCPANGNRNTLYVFKIKYADADGHLPAIGYPKLHIIKGATTSQTGVEISSSPYTMSFSSGSYLTGAIYISSVTISQLGTDYTYYFETQDILGGNTTTIISSGPVVGNLTPSLCWCNESGYISDGVYPDTGSTDTQFCFKIKYDDPDNDQPAAGYPKLHIFISTTEVLTVSMVNSSSVYTYVTTFSTASNKYSYYFDCCDSSGAVITTSTKTFIVSSPPVLSNNVSITEGQTVTGGKVVLTWSATDADGDSLSYVLYFGDNINSLPIISSGTKTSYELKSLSPGKTYYWRVDVKDSKGIVTQGLIRSFNTLSIPGNRVYNYPNPFNPNKAPTNIVFNAEESGTVEMSIYTEFGDKIFSESISVPKGVNTYQYNGRDINNEILKSGTYLVIVKTSEEIKKSVILVMRK